MFDFDPDAPINFNRSDRELQEFILFSVTVPGMGAQRARRALQNFFKTEDLLSGDAPFLYEEIVDAFQEYMPEEIEPFDYLYLMLSPARFVVNLKQFVPLNNLDSWQKIVDIGKKFPDWRNGNIYPTALNNIKRRLKKCGIRFWPQVSKAFMDILKKNPDLRNATIEELQEIYRIGPKTARFFVLHSREGARVAVLDVHILAELREWGYDAPLQTPTSKKQYLKFEQIFLERCDMLGKTPSELDFEIWLRRRREF